MRNKLFTLIELLIVLAIIAILISILLPSLNKAKEKGRSALCLSNQSQIYRSSMIWSNNNNGWTPYGHTWYVFSGSNNLKSGTHNLWMAIGNVVKDNIIAEAEGFNCPSNRRHSFNYGTSDNPFKAEHKPNLTGYNFSTNLQQFDDRKSLTLDPGEKKFFTSMLEKQALSMDAYWHKNHWDNSHEDFFNVAYSDGHAKSVKHKNIPVATGITAFSTSFNNKVQEMWTDLEKFF